MYSESGTPVLYAVRCGARRTGPAAPFIYRLVAGRGRRRHPGPDLRVDVLYLGTGN